MSRERRTPVSLEEWQQAADAAQGALALEAARQYGLVTGGPAVNIARCTTLLEQAAERGVTPRADAAERFARELWSNGAA